MLHPSILAIDTSTGPSSVALWQNGHIMVFLENNEKSMQSAHLMPLVEAVLAQAKIGYGDLSAIACTVGPGSFTGIRTGLAAARGICLAAGIKGLGFTTLEVVATAANTEKPVLAVLNAGKGEQYYQGFAGGKPLFEPRVGQAIDAPMPAGFITLNALPRADALAKLAAAHGSSALPLTPFYIRPPDAKPMAERMTVDR